MTILSAGKRDESSALIAVTNLLVAKSITKLAFILTSINEQIISGLGITSIHGAHITQKKCPIYAPSHTASHITETQM